MKLRLYNTRLNTLVTFTRDVGHDGSYEDWVASCYAYLVNDRSWQLDDVVPVDRDDARRLKRKGTLVA